MSAKRARWSRTTFLVCLLLLAIPVGAASCDESYAPPPECERQWWCDYCDSVCVAGKCACPCTTTKDCPMAGDAYACSDSGVCGPCREPPAPCKVDDDCCERVCIDGTCRKHFLAAGAACTSEHDCGYVPCTNGRCACLPGGYDFGTSTASPPGCKGPCCENTSCCSKHVSNVDYSYPDGTSSSSDVCCGTLGEVCDDLFVCDRGEECLVGRCCALLEGACGDDGDCCSGHCVENACKRTPSGAPCKDPSQCVSGACQDGQCACDALGAACSRGATCCSSTCTGSTCACGGAGADCVQGGDCCSGVCSATPGTCACSAPGASCGATTDCCFGSCQGGSCVCSPIGAVCGDGKLCCSGTCENGSCVCAPKGGTCETGATCCSGTCTEGVCACAATSGTCATGDDCCSGSCASGQCQCAAAGAPCADGVICCSGTCQDGACT